MILQKLNKTKVNIFIDLQSIVKGFYKKDTALFEITEYYQRQNQKDKLPTCLLNELKIYLNNIYSQFKNYDPFFIIFYDDGKNTQNTIISNTYKSGRTHVNAILDEEQHVDIIKAVKKYYFKSILNKFTKKDLSVVYYIPEYETDVVPHYIISKNYFDSKDTNMLNIILSVDKDLLQTCLFPNTIQCVTSFIIDKKTNMWRPDFKIYDNKNAISYIYKKFKPGILTAKYIPLILALSGDKSDFIPGIPKIGPAKATKLIIENNIPHELIDIKRDINKMPQIIQNNIDLIIKNMKMISFDLQMERLPENFLRSGYHVDSQ